MLSHAPICEAMPWPNAASSWLHGPISAAQPPRPTPSFQLSSDSRILYNDGTMSKRAALRLASHFRALGFRVEIRQHRPRMGVTTEYDRRQLAEYCKEHDRLMVEEREMAERELIYKTTTRPAPTPTPTLEVIDDV